MFVYDVAVPFTSQCLSLVDGYLSRTWTSTPNLSLAQTVGLHIFIASYGLPWRKLFIYRGHYEHHTAVQLTSHGESLVDGHIPSERGNPSW